MSIPGTVQSVAGNPAPITALDNPPEGQVGVKLSFPFTPSTLPSAGSIYQLNNAGTGLPMSQVVTIVIDNSQNPNGVTVTHGIFNEVVTVPANSTQVVPTFSSKSFFPLSMILNGGKPTISFSVNIIALNYARQASTLMSNTGQIQNNQIQATASSLTIVDTAFTLYPLGNAAPIKGSYYTITTYSVSATHVVPGTSPGFPQFQLILGFTSNNSAFITGTQFWEEIYQWSSTDTTYLRWQLLANHDDQSIVGPVGAAPALGLIASNLVTDDGAYGNANVNLSYYVTALS